MKKRYFVLITFLFCSICLFADGIHIFIQTNFFDGLGESNGNPTTASCEIFANNGKIKIVNLSDHKLSLFQKGTYFLIDTETKKVFFVGQNGYFEFKSDDFNEVFNVHPLLSIVKFASLLKDNGDFPKFILDMFSKHLPEIKISDSEIEVTSIPPKEIMGYSCVGKQIIAKYKAKAVLRNKIIEVDEEKSKTEIYFLSNENIEKNLKGQYFFHTGLLMGDLSYDNKLLSQIGSPGMPIYIYTEIFENGKLDSKIIYEVKTIKSVELQETNFNLPPNLKCMNKKK